MDAGDEGCRSGESSQIAFVQIQSPNLAAQSPAQALLTINGKSSLPADPDVGRHCGASRKKIPAVVFVVSLATAERLYTGMFGGGRKFAAHVANYPVCYGANNTAIPALYPPAQKGTQFLNLTGAPVLIQIGSKDDYDNGSGHCRALVQAVNPANENVVELAEYAGTYHAWDRLMIRS